jgi:basic membrane protein A
MRKVIVAILAVVMIVACSPVWAELKPIPEDRIQAAYLFVGPVGDHGYTYMHNAGAMAAQEAHPGIKTYTAESVPEGAEVGRVMQQYIRKGANVIFSTSYGYKYADNVGSYYGRMYEAYYLAGMAAGKMTKSNILGYVGAYPIPDIIGEINAFTLGARKVNPEATVKVIWLFSWYDPAKESEAGHALIDAGVDVINIHVDSAAIARMAEDKGVYVIGCNSDMSKFAPTKQLTAQVWNWGVLYNAVIDRIIDGTWNTDEILMGMKEGAVQLAPFSPETPQEVIDLVEAEKQKIISGECTVFDGPLVDQSGKKVLEEGKSLSYKEIHSIHYFLEGVEGTIPQ